MVLELGLLCRVRSSNTRYLFAWHDGRTEPKIVASGKLTVLAVTLQCCQHGRAGVCICTGSFRMAAVCPSRSAGNAVGFEGLAEQGDAGMRFGRGPAASGAGRPAAPTPGAEGWEAAAAALRWGLRAACPPPPPRSLGRAHTGSPHRAAGRTAGAGAGRGGGRARRYRGDGAAGGGGGRRRPGRRRRTEEAHGGGRAAAGPETLPPPPRPPLFPPRRHSLL